MLVTDLVSLLCGDGISPGELHEDNSNGESSNSSHISSLLVEADLSPQTVHRLVIAENNPKIFKSLNSQHQLL